MPPHALRAGIFYIHVYPAGGAPRSSVGYAALRSSMEDYDPAPVMTYEQATAQAQRSYDKYRAKQKAFDEKYSGLEHPEQYYGYRQRSQELGRLQEECVKMVDHMRRHYREMEVEPLFTLSGPVEDPEPYQQQVSAMMSEMEDYIEASNGLPDPAELQRQQTQIVRLQNALGLTNTTATEEEKGYWERSLEQVILGNYSDEVTLAGTAGQVLLGLTGLDVVTDLRDLSYDLTHFREAGLVQTLLDAVGLIPGLGILKNADEVVTLLKNALPQLMPYADEMAAVLRRAFQGGSPALGALAGSTRYADDLADAAANGKYVDEVAESGKYLSGPGKQSTEWGETDRIKIEIPDDRGTQQAGLSEVSHAIESKRRDTRIKLPTGESVTLTPGSRITHVQTIAGMGRNRQIDIVDWLVDRHPGTDAYKWTKRKGIGYVDYNGESFKAELHWYEEPSVGRVDFKLKPDADGNWFYED